MKLPSAKPFCINIFYFGLQWLSRVSGSSQSHSLGSHLFPPIHFLHFGLSLLPMMLTHWNACFAVLSGEWLRIGIGCSWPSRYRHGTPGTLPHKGHWRMAEVFPPSSLESWPHGHGWNRWEAQIFLELGWESPDSSRRSRELGYGRGRCFTTTTTLWINFMGALLFNYC